MQERLKHNDWTGRTGGTKWMQQSLIYCFRFLPLWIYYVVVALVIPFYMLFNHKGYLSSYHFFRQSFGYGALKSFCHVYLNEFCFGQIIVDRFAKYAGKEFRFDIENYELFQKLSSAESSFMILSAHVGNYEMAGYTLTSSHKRMNVMVYDRETETVMENRSEQFTKNNIYMIAVKEDMSHLFKINNALCEGEIVSMPADRLFGSSKSLKCQFFGREAKFPKGPFATATQRDIPVIAVFVLKSGYKSYDIKIVEMAKHSKEVGMTQLAQRFANTMESILKTYRTQWFNYYDFWS